MGGPQSFRSGVLQIYYVVIAIELNYSMIQSAGEFVDHNLSTLLDEELDQCSFPNWAEFPSSPHDFLNDITPSNESILEFMILFEIPWEYSHYISSFLLNMEKMEKELKSLVSIDVIDQSQFPSTSYPMPLEGNLRNISKTNSIEILVKLRVVEHI